MSEYPIYILDLGWGNINSLKLFFKKLGCTVSIIGLDFINVAENNDYICVIPGIGSARKFSEISQQKMSEVKSFVAGANKTIGICLGAHFLTTQTEEAKAKGLDFVECNVKCIKTGFQIGYKKVTYNGHRFRIYHCHNFYMPTTCESASSGVFADGIQYSQIIRKENLFLIQGHPEKSGADGERLVTSVLSETCP